MTLRAVLLLAALLLVVAAPFPAEERAVASCAGPTLDLPGGPGLPRGEVVVVTGAGFQDGCQDGGSCTVTPGCSRCVESEPPEVPRSDVRLRLLQQGRGWDLGTAGADARSRVAWRFVVPTSARPGPARLLADGAGPVRVRLT